MVTIQSLCERLRPTSILGLDAYGVIYNSSGPFKAIYSVFDHCATHGIDIYMITNNSNQSIAEISKKMDEFGLHIPIERIVSSGLACHWLPDVKHHLAHQRVFVYGKQSSRSYVNMANATIVESPHEADTIVLAASLDQHNHYVYKAVHDALRKRPTMPVVCINADHYVMNTTGLTPVMGFYAHQMAKQLGHTHWIWAAKPSPRFSDMLHAILMAHGRDPSQLVFCDDNPNNVRQIAEDLNCTGIVISETGIANHVPIQQPMPDHIVSLAQCRVCPPSA